MKWMKKILDKRRVKNTLNSLGLFKTTVKDMGTLDSGIEFLNEKFDMTQYLLNCLDRDLMRYTGKSGFLDSETQKLSKLRVNYLEEKKAQKELLIMYNSQHEQQAAMLTANEVFLFKYYDVIKEIEENAHSIAIKVLYVDKPDKMGKVLASKYLSYKSLKILDDNLDCYSNFFVFENFMRKYILEKYREKYEVEDLSKWIKKPYLDEYSRRKNEEQQFGISARGNNIIYYLDFDILAEIIQNHFKDGFDKDFKRIEDIVPKLKYLYHIRCKIAHASLSVTADEYKISKDYIIIILNQLSNKYKRLSA